MEGAIIKKMTIQRNWQHRVHKTKTNKTQHNICWTPLYTNNLNKTSALLQATGDKNLKYFMLVYITKDDI